MLYNNFKNLHEYFFSGVSLSRLNKKAGVRMEKSGWNRRKKSGCREAEREYSTSMHLHVVENFFTLNWRTH